MTLKDRYANRWKPLAVLALLGIASGLRAQTNFSISPPPEWVRTVEWNASNPSLKSGKIEGTRHLLYERQENPRLQEEFTRIILRMENETGVQDSGNLSFHFDPSYQELVLHRVKIHRGGQDLDRLDASKIKVIQPERALGMDVFTGNHSALLFIEDLRVGDALEYAHTIRGANPIIGDHYSTRLIVESSMPVDRQRMRVVWPTAKSLHIRQHLTDSPPAKMTSNGTAEYVWDFTNLTAIVYEDCLPAAFELYPYIELSDFDNWARVVEWALPLYTIENTNLPPELQELINQWQDSSSSAEELAAVALQFVQDDLRYTGIELGPDSFRPAPPFETFQKRFGDCKGKALLYCTLLRAMNFEAWPALVNTSTREAIARRLPSPFAFNHVIVKLNMAGQTIWVDPTISHQGGRLANRHVLPLGKALVIESGVTALEDIPPPRTENFRQRVTSTLRMKDYESPVSFSVKTTFFGVGADNTREQVARSDLQELGKDYLNFYARYYPGIQALRPLEVSDDRTNNILTVTEYYQITNLWKLDGSSKQWEAEFYAESLHDVLTDPTTRLRKLPLGFSFPLRREQEVVVHLPDDDWTIPKTEETVEHEAFVFRYRRQFSGSVVRFQYECETRIRELPAEKVAGYLEKLEEMENLLGDTLQRPDNSARSILAQMNWLMVVVAAFGVIGVMIGSVWIWRASQAPASLPPLIATESQLQGLGGWLILVGIGICIAPLVRIGGIAQHWEGYFSLDVWQEVAMPQGEQYHALYAPLLIFEVLANIFLLALNGLVLCLFFAKRRFFPKAYIALLVSNAAFILIDELLGNRIPFVAEQSDASSAREIFRATLAALIWSSYMLKSRRVKATFIR